MLRLFGIAVLAATVAVSGSGNSARITPGHSGTPSSAQKPQITSIAPTKVTVGDPAFLLSVNASHLDDPDRIEGPFAILFGSDMLSTTVVSDALLTATVPAQDITTAGKLSGEAL